MKARLRDWFLHLMGWHIRLRIKYWKASCGKVMRADECSCGQLHNIRPLHKIKLKFVNHE